MTGPRTVLRRWRPALRLARRDLLRHPFRTVVVALVVALPIAVATVVSTVATTTDYRSANSLQLENGTADARLTVTPWPAVRTRVHDAGRYVDWTKPRGSTRADRRDPAGVDLARLLPPGSTLTRVGTVRATLALGGTIDVRVVDLASPLTRGLARLESGSPPRTAGQAAVTRSLATELDLLDGAGRLRGGAVLPLVDRDLAVTGVVASALDPYDDSSDVVVSPATDLPTSGRGGGAAADYLLDLPPGAPSTSAAQRTLADDLAAAGVSGFFRDGVEHPAAWGFAAPPPRPVEPAALAAGALAIGLGLVEVIVLVGAVFAVGARRQARTLGVVMAAGGTPADLRRTVLAQGVWVGTVAAVLGLAGGALGLVAGRGLLERLVGLELLQYAVSPGTLAAVAILGVTSAVLAALVPAWGVGRMTATQALGGHVPAAVSRERPGSDSRLAAPAGALVAAGLLGLLVCGPWIASEYAGDPDVPSVLPLMLGSLAALVLLVGTLLAVPSLVRWTGRRLGHGWLPWRLATRDGARHPARTAAAVVAVGIVAAGAVLTGFGVAAADAFTEIEQGGPRPGVSTILLDPAEARDPVTRARIVDRVETTLDADAVLSRDVAVRDGRPVLAAGGEVSVVTDDWLRVAGATDAERAAFSDGSAVLGGRGASAPPAALRLQTGRGADRVVVGPVPAVTGRSLSDALVLVSAATAARLGLTVRPGDELWAYCADGSTADPAQRERLALYGVEAAYQYQGTPPTVLVYAGAAVGVALTVLVVGMVVALSTAEGRSDAATLAAVGATPWVGRATAAAQAAYVGSLGGAVGLLLGCAVGASLLQVAGTPGTPVPWGGLAIVALGIPVLCTVTGWCVAPRRLPLTRRAA